MRRRDLGFDYGKFDYVIHEGRAILLDANSTPGSVFSGVCSSRIKVPRPAAQAWIDRMDRTSAEPVATHSDPYTRPDVRLSHLVRPDVIVSARPHHRADAWLPIPEQSSEFLSAGPMTVRGELALVVHHACATRDS